MSEIASQLALVRQSLPAGVTLVAVSKTHPAEAIRTAYGAGQRIFGESRPQELRAKYEALPKDIVWHMIGHLQTNKIKYIAPFIALIESVDSARLAEAIQKEAVKCGRVIDILLEIHVAAEETKTGWNLDELRAYLAADPFAGMPNLRVRGVMGIATNTDDETQSSAALRCAAVSRSCDRSSARRSTPSRWACRTTTRWPSRADRPWCASGR